MKPIKKFTIKNFNIISDDLRVLLSNGFNLNRYSAEDLMTYYEDKRTYASQLTLAGEVTGPYVYDNLDIIEKTICDKANIKVLKMKIAG